MKKKNKNKRRFRNISSFLFLAFGVESISFKIPYSISVGIFFVFLAILVLPYLDDLLLKLNITLTFKQKLFIGITNFLTAAYLVSPKEKDFSKCFISFFAMLLFWILTIAYSKIKKRKIFDK